MTVKEEMIAQVSPFEVGTDFDLADFEQYKTWAEEELDRDDPGLSTAAYDQAHANLICDIFVSSKGGRNFKSEKIGDYSYSKDGGDKSSYRIRYEEILRQFAGEQPTAGQEHEDLDYVPNSFKLDQSPVQKFEEQD